MNNLQLGDAFYEMLNKSIESGTIDRHLLTVLRGLEKKSVLLNAKNSNCLPSTAIDRMAACTRMIINQLPVEGCKEKAEDHLQARYSLIESMIRAIVILEVTCETYMDSLNTKDPVDPF